MREDGFPLARSRPSSESWFAGLGPERQAIWILLVVSFIRGAVYAIIVPAWQSADESNYFVDLQGFAKQILPAIARAPIGKVLGHRLFFEAAYMPPYLATQRLNVYLQLLVLRFVSVLLGVAAVYVVYRIAKAFAPKDRVIILGAPLFVAFIPQFSHITGSMSPDILATLAASLFFLFALLLIRDGFNPWRVGGLVASMGVAILTKQTAFFVVPMALLLPAAVILRRKPDGLQAKRRNERLGMWAACLIVLVPLAAWLGGKVTQASFGLDALGKALNPTLVVEALGQLKLPANPLFKSFWAWIGMLTVPLIDQYYAVLVTLGAAAVAGVIAYLVRAAVRRGDVERWQVVTTIFFILAVVLEVLIVLVRQRSAPEAGLAQGRWVFPALGPIAVLSLLGWRQPFLDRGENGLLAAVGANMAALDAVVIWGYIIGAYYEKFPARINQSILNFGWPLTPKVGWETANMRPALLVQPIFYSVLFATYLAMLIYWCFVTFSRPESPAREDG